MELYRDAPDEWNAEGLFLHSIAAVRSERRLINEQIELARKEGKIKSSLEASVTWHKGLVNSLKTLGVTDEETYSNPADPDDSISDYFIVSEFIMSDEAKGITIVDLKSADGYSKCERSWKYFKGDGDITPRDAAAVAALG